MTSLSLLHLTFPPRFAALFFRYRNAWIAGIRLKSRRRSRKYATQNQQKIFFRIGVSKFLQRFFGVKIARCNTKVVKRSVKSNRSPTNSGETYGGPKNFNQDQKGRTMLRRFRTKSRPPSTISSSLSIIKNNLSLPSVKWALIRTSVSRYSVLQ